MNEEHLNRTRQSSFIVPRSSFLTTQESISMNPEELAEQRRKRYNATVVWLRKIQSDLLILRVRPDFPVPAHKPGQYTTLGLGYWEPRFPGCQEQPLQPGDETKLARRSYSISCSVLDDYGRLLDRDRVDWLEFYV